LVSIRPHRSNQIKKLVTLSTHLHIYDGWPHSQQKKYGRPPSIQALLWNKTFSTGIKVVCRAKVRLPHARFTPWHHVRCAFVQLVVANLSSHPGYSVARCDRRLWHGFHPSSAIYLYRTPHRRVFIYKAFVCG
jgi:hypothetical protein